MSGGRAHSARPLIQVAANRNFYWLSADPDVIDLDGAPCYAPSLEGHASLHALARLPAAPLRLQALRTDNGVLAPLHDDGATLAFFRRLSLLRGAAEEARSTYFSDNYVGLLPGERLEPIASSSLLATGGGIGGETRLLFEATAAGKRSFHGFTTIVDYSYNFVDLRLPQRQAAA